MQTLKSIRKEKGITKKAMYQHLGISQKTYDNYERHPSQMRIEMAKSAADYLGVDVSQIFFLSDSK